MQYRQYGRGGPRVSRLGFGAMRLPTRQKDNWGTVNLPRAAAVIRRALSQGVNFLDTHHNYHAGLSERAIGKALAGWKGHPVTIQTKTPMYRPEKMAFFKGLVEQALEKLGVQCIDYLFFHSMEMGSFKKRGKMFFRLTDWAMKRGYVRRRGCSTHDTPEHVKAFIDTGEFSAILMSYNWLNPQMAETLAYAADKGLGVSVMNPVGGGHLAADTKAITRLLPGAKTSAEVGLRYVLGTPGVAVVLSGMTTAEQVDENVRTAGRKTPMTARQWAIMNRRLEALRARAQVVCTACGYCMPCPAGVNIPENLVLLSRAKLFGLTDYARAMYDRLARRRAGDASAKACKRCGACLPKCPNDVPIIDLLAETAETLGR